ncbi:MAG: rane protein [Pseudonocardia sp.]|uniref:MmpS family transport accessory protein n=1 Tax=Pseudonocardia sp. TaxID=60912 RepID=UPI002637F57E|nr:MmpS family transport accessory protein [Pseudonocardia sp.]MCU1630194.1 rane protein [Pseudonocardia sp.]MDT7700452.1 rane protein [Pseudonocardiales bacterium]
MVLAAVGLGAVLLLGVALVVTLRSGDRGPSPAPAASTAAAPATTTTSTTAPTTTPAPALATVDYEVTSDGPLVDVTYADGTGVHSLSHVPAPWATRVQIPAGPMLGALVIAQAAGRATKVSCRILVDGVQVATMFVRGTSPVMCRPGD